MKTKHPEVALQDPLSFWRGMSFARRLALVGTTAAVFIAVLALGRVGGSSGMALLYAGLDSRAAGEVIAALDQTSAPYEVRGDAIYVSERERDALRMQLAAEGLPVTGGQGYELLDGLSGFGTTSQMFDAAYWRAKEGELARTALAIPNVRMARVHISRPSTQGFWEDQPVSASVTVRMSQGRMSEQQAHALRNLVASAVGGMSPSDVTVIDSLAGVIGSNEGALESVSTDAARARAQSIRENVERLLAARVGPGRSVVEVQVELVREREAITERLIDPEGRVAISSENETRSESATQPADDVTVASNLPEGDASQGGDGRSESTETRERVNFEVSETQREILREPGDVRRLTVAVLVDGTRTVGLDGASEWQPRAEEELADLRELVSSAAGINPERGDVLTLKSMELMVSEELGQISETTDAFFSGPIDMTRLAQMVILAIVALGLGGLVLRPLLLQARRERSPVAPSGAASALPSPMLSPPMKADVLTGEITDGDTPPLALVNPEDRVGGDLNRDEAVSRLRRLIESRQAETVEILRGWLERNEGRG